MPVLFLKWHDLAVHVTNGCNSAEIFSFECVMIRYLRNAFQRRAHSATWPRWQ